MIQMTLIKRVQNEVKEMKMFYYLMQKQKNEWHHVANKQNAFHL